MLNAVLTVLTVVKDYFLISDHFVGLVESRETFESEHSTPMHGKTLFILGSCHFLDGPGGRGKCRWGHF